MLTILVITFAVVETLLGVAVTYLLVLTVAAAFSRRNHDRILAPRLRFAVLIPAHDEELVIAETLTSLRWLDYPTALFDVHVVADNCRDRTADVARRFERFLNLTIHERHDDEKRGKGYAVEWLLDRLGRQHGYDAFVMLDADWTVAPNLLDVMNTRLQSGDEIVQAWCRPARPDESWVTGLRCIALALVNFVRPLGSDALGLSCGLNGSGMGFNQNVLRQQGWHSYSLAEDVEQHIKFLLNGTRVAFAPETYVESRMPSTLAAARSQNLRWESGKIALVRDHALALIRAGLRSGSVATLLGAVALLVPPLSILAALCFGAVIVALALGRAELIILALALVAGLALHVGAGLAMVRPPRAVYLSLLLAPVFIAWKLRVYLAALRRRGRGPWVRTSRPGEVF